MKLTFINEPKIFESSCYLEIIAYEDNTKLTKMIKEWMNCLFKVQRSVGCVIIKRQPGCCGISIMTGLKIYPQYRNKGYARQVVKHCIETSKNDLCGMLKATCTNDTMIKIFQECGFTQTSVFINPQTENTVYEFSLILNQEHENI